MRVIISHVTTGPAVQHAARALWEAGALERYYTSVYEDQNSRWQKFACAAARLGGYDFQRQIRRRAITEVPQDRVTGFPAGELIRLAVSAIDRSGRLTDRVWEWAEPKFDLRVAREVHAGLDAVYGYEFSSLGTFQAARQLGVRTIYDAPAPETTIVQSILDQEYEKFPELQSSYRRQTLRREPFRAERRRAEWLAADRVVVASNFTRESFARAGLDIVKTRVVPLGAPPPAARDVALLPRSPNHPATFLWAGTFSIRKGGHYLLEAWKRGNFGASARLKVFGAVTLPDRVVRPIPPGVEFGGSIPRSELMQEYRMADALVFPTLCDGFGMVATEAWSQGLPVITTDRAGVADLVRAGENGIVARAASAPALQECLEWVMTHRAEVAAMRESALATAASWQWSDYRRALVAATLADHVRGAAK